MLILQGAMVVVSLAVEQDLVLLEKVGLVAVDITLMLAEIVFGDLQVALR